MRYASLAVLAAAVNLLACAGTGSQTAQTADTKKTTSASTATPSAPAPAATPAHGGKLYVQAPALYDKDSGVQPKIKEECVLDAKVSQRIQESAKGAFDVVASKTLADAGSNKALSLTIVGVQGVGGGAWSGPKSITLKGSLKQGGKVIGTFTARRTSGGGMWGGYKGTCSIFDRDAEALGKDVAAWLAAPSMDAKLGELN